MTSTAVASVRPSLRTVISKVTACPTLGAGVSAVDEKNGTYDEKLRWAVALVMALPDAQLN